MTGSNMWRRLGALAGAVAMASGAAAAVPRGADAAEGAWASAGSMAVGRNRAAAVTLQDGRVLVLGGNSTSAEPEVFYPANKSFGKISPLPVPSATYEAARLTDGRVVAVATDDSVPGVLGTTVVYDPVQNLWTPAAHLLVPRKGIAVAPLPNGKLLAVGGTDPVTNSSRGAQIFDPATRTWAAGPSMNVDIAQAEAVVLPTGKVLVAGNGRSQVYGPNAMSWSTAGGSAGSPEQLTVLSDGRVLSVAADGGRLYSAATNAWTFAASLNMPRTGFTLAPLPNGRAMVAGGALTDPLATTKEVWYVEVFDPDTSTFGYASAMRARHGHFAAPLPNGKVLIGGGMPSGALKTAQVFDSGGTTAEAPVLQLHPPLPARPFGNPADVHAVLFNGTTLEPMLGVPILFQVAEGLNTGVSGFCTTMTYVASACTTGDYGKLRWQYSDVANALGTDLVLGFADLNGNSAFDAGEPSDTALLTWTGYPTRLTADPAVATVRFSPFEATAHVEMRAALWDYKDAKLEGRTLRFVTDGDERELCVAVVASDGWARCSFDQKLESLTNNYLVRFDGDSYYSPNMENARIARVASVNVG